MRRKSFPAVVAHTSLVSARCLPSMVSGHQHTCASQQSAGTTVATSHPLGIEERAGSAGVEGAVFDDDVEQ